MSSDVLIRFKVAPGIIVLETLRIAMRQHSLHEGDDYELLAVEESDPLKMQPTGDEASGKQLYYLNKLREDVTKSFNAWCHNPDGESYNEGSKLHGTLVLETVKKELQEGVPTKRRASDMIEALKELGASL